jgi:hypothetical protein
VVNRTRLLYVVIAVAIVVAATTYFFGGDASTSNDSSTYAADGSRKSTLVAKDSAGRTPGKPGTAEDAKAAPLSPIAGRLEFIFAGLLDGSIGEADLEALKRYLLAADPVQATAAILGSSLPAATPTLALISP